MTCGWSTCDLPSSEHKEIPCSCDEITSYISLAALRRTEGGGLPEEGAGGRPAVARAVDAAVAQPRVPAVWAPPLGVAQRLVHVLAVPHEEAVPAEDALHNQIGYKTRLFEA